MRDVDTGEPVDADTVFQLASLPKPISSTIVASNVGAGDASWDSVVADRPPDFVLTGKFRQIYSYSNIMMTAGALAAAAPLGQS